MGQHAWKELIDINPCESENRFTVFNVVLKIHSSKAQDSDHPGSLGFDFTYIFKPVYVNLFMQGSPDGDKKKPDVATVITYK